MLAVEHQELLSRTDVNGTLRFIMEWLSDLDGRVTTNETSNADLEATVLALNGRVTTAEAEAATAATLAGSLTASVTDLGARLAALELQLHKPRTFTITIPTERNTSTMAFQIVDSDTTKVASLTFTDALGFPTVDADATAAFATSDAAVITIDATTGAITPVAPGPAQIQATVTNADGSSVTGAPADVEVLAGAAVAFAIGIA